jgi:membrane protein YqaA with SNARE-associated domain
LELLGLSHALAARRGILYLSVNLILYLSAVVLVNTLKKIDWFLIFILVVLTLFSIFFHFQPEHATPIQLATYQNLLITFQTAMWAVFIASLVGNILPVPTPYVVVLWLAAVKYCELGVGYVLLLAFIASLGSLLGEMLSYTVGRALNRVPDIRESKNISLFGSILTQNPRWAPVFIFLFGATPLNDDLLMVPLGIIKYPAKKTIVFCWLGKLAMMVAVAFLPDIFAIADPTYSFFTTMVPLYFIILTLYLMFRVEWFAVVQKSPCIQKRLHLEPSSDTLGGDY